MCRYREFQAAAVMMVITLIILIILAKYTGLQSPLSSFAMEITVVIAMVTTICGEAPA